jgi:hypothetical protein
VEVQNVCRNTLAQTSISGAKGVCGYVNMPRVYTKLTFNCQAQLKNAKLSVTYEVFTAVTKKNAVFWDIKTLCKI